MSFTRRVRRSVPVLRSCASLLLSHLYLSRRRGLLTIAAVTLLIYYLVWFVHLIKPRLSRLEIEEFHYSVIRLFGPDCFGWDGRSNPIYIHASGEPRFDERAGLRADLIITSGGYNLARDRAVFNPVLIGACCNKNVFARSKGENISSLGLVRVGDRNFADVLYRSGLCEPRREAAVAIIRKKIEQAGFVFKATGLCGGAGYPLTPGWNGRGEWTRCDFDCNQSKIMISFERFYHNMDYLSEKLFIPFEYGAIPVYMGNGHSIMDLLTVNRHAFVDSINYRSVDLLADELIRLLQNPAELQRMQDEPVFLDWQQAYNRIRFVFSPLEIGEKGAPELYKIIEFSDRLRGLKDRPTLSYYRLRERPPNATNMLMAMFNAEKVVEVNPLSKCPDIILDWCC